MKGPYLDSGQEKDRSFGGVLCDDAFDVLGGENRRWWWLDGDQ